MTKISPQRGMRGYMATVSHEAQPPGLPNGTVVEVIATFGQEIQVKTEDGTEHIVNHWQVNVGYLYLMPGNRRLRENHPDVIQYLKAEMQEAQAMSPSLERSLKIEAVQRLLDLTLFTWPPPWNPQT